MSIKKNFELCWCCDGTGECVMFVDGEYINFECEECRGYGFLINTAYKKKIKRKLGIKVKNESQKGVC